ncbi:MAG: hypothetical protein ABIR17_09115 [Pseudolysinimonas sp.]
MAAIAVVAVSGGVAVTAANAATLGHSRTSALDLVPPTEKVGDSLLYDEATARDAWKAVVDAFPESYPKGYAPPTDLRTTYEKTDGERLFFEASLIDMMIAEDYRCSWLTAGELGTVAPDEVSAALATYWSLPSVAEFDQSGLTIERLAAIAKEQGFKSSNEALLAYACSGWEN